MVLPRTPLYPWYERRPPQPRQRALYGAGDGVLPLFHQHARPGEKAKVREKAVRRGPLQKWLADLNGVHMVLHSKRPPLKNFLKNRKKGLPQTVIFSKRTNRLFDSS